MGSPAVSTEVAVAPKRGPNDPPQVPIVNTLIDESLLPYYTEEDLAELDDILTSGVTTDWREWMDLYFADVCYAPRAPRHERLCQWFDDLKVGTKPHARIEAWPRAGAKSSTVELNLCRCAETLVRRFALYVSATQAQADLHVQSVGAFMEHRGQRAALNQYGRAKGWNRQQLRTNTGFNLAAFGLDAATRGIKIEQYRPDLIILDDVDSHDDGPVTTKAKIAAITTAILPAGSADCAVLFVQNLMHEDSIMAQLVDGRADFLRDRDVIQPEPAVRGLEYETVTDDDGRRLYKITAGEATWEGQPLPVCQAQMNEWGERAFLREAQHEVKGDPRNAVFDVVYLRGILPAMAVPVETYQPGQNGLGGTLEVWERPIPGVRYVVGADVAEGLKKDKTDESTADVLRTDTWEHVASYYGKPDPRSFGIDLWNLSEWYNRAIVIPENNAIGVGTVHALEEMGANLWYSDPDDADEEGTAGMRTLPRTKGLVDGELRSAIVDAAAGRKSIVLRSKRVVEQLIHYVYMPDKTRGGEGQWHDDHVRSLGLAWFVAKDYGLRPPVKPYEPKPNPYGGLWRRRGA